LGACPASTRRSGRNV